MEKRRRRTDQLSIVKWYDAFLDSRAAPFVNGTWKTIAVGSIAWFVWNTAPVVKEAASILIEYQLQIKSNTASVTVLTRHNEQILKSIRELQDLYLNNRKTILEVDNRVENNTHRIMRLEKKDG